MHKLCLSRFRLVALFCCLVAPPFAKYDERQHVTTFIANLAVFKERVSAMPEAPQGWGGNTSNLPKHATFHHSRNYQNVMINFHRRTRRRGQRRNDSRTCSIKIFDNEQAVIVEANRHRLPNLLLWPQRQEVTYTMRLPMTIHLLHLLSLAKQVHHWQR